MVPAGPVNRRARNYNNEKYEWTKTRRSHAGLDTHGSDDTPIHGTRSTAPARIDSRLARKLTCPGGVVGLCSREYRRNAQGRSESGGQPRKRSGPRELEFRNWSERSHPECDEHSACHPVKPVKRLGPHKPVDYAGDQPTHGHAAVIRFYGKVRLLRLGRHATRIFLFPQEKQSDLGRRAATPTSHGNKDRDSGVGIIRHGPIRRCLGTTQQLDARIPGSYRNVCSWKSRLSGRKSVPGVILH